jgi:hypothetical protein
MIVPSLSWQLMTSHEETHRNQGAVFAPAVAQCRLQAPFVSNCPSRAGPEPSSASRSAVSWRPPHLRKWSSFLSFPCVCPEPVLVKRSHLCINGSKLPFSYSAVGVPADRSERDNAPVRSVFHVISSRACLDKWSCFKRKGRKKPGVFCVLYLIRKSQFPSWTSQRWSKTAA